MTQWNAERARYISADVKLQYGMGSISENAALEAVEMLDAAVAEVERLTTKNSSVLKTAQVIENQCAGYEETGDCFKAERDRLAADLAAAREENKTLGVICANAEIDLLACQAELRLARHDDDVFGVPISRGTLRALVARLRAAEKVCEAVDTAAWEQDMEKAMAVWRALAKGREG